MFLGTSFKFEVEPTQTSLCFSPNNKKKPIKGKLGVLISKLNLMGEMDASDVDFGSTQKSSLMKPEADPQVN